MRALWQTASGVESMKLMEVAATQLRVQIGHQWDKDCGHQLDKTPIAHQGGKLAAQMTLDILGVVGFEGAIVRLLEQNDNRHDLTRVHLAWAQALSLL
jgi:hypothetical protein